MAIANDLYFRLIRAPAESHLAEQDLDSEVRDLVGANGLRQMTASALQSIGDQVVNAKTVLPWVLSALGAPTFLLGLLVPIRESGSMLPQAALSPWLGRQRFRARIWAAGAIGQGVSVGAMAALALTARGWVAGVGIVLALAVFASARALNSLASKDVLGRTIPLGQRGQINGTVTVVSGAVAIALGLGLRVLGGQDAERGVLAAMLAAAAICWLVAAFVFVGVVEPAGPITQPAAQGEVEPGWASQAVTALREDSLLRRFVIVRALLLVSALSPPFVIAMAVAEDGGGLGGLGLFVVAQGVASLLAGRLFGRLADRSSRRLMVVGSLLSSIVVLGYLGLLALPGSDDWSLLHPLTFLLLAFVHTGVRVARKTYVIDMAGDQKRTQYVAVSNSAIGVLLLLAGAISSVLAVFGNEVALIFLATLGFVGAYTGRKLPEVEGPS